MSDLEMDSVGSSSSSSKKGDGNKTVWIIVIVGLIIIGLAIGLGVGLGAKKSDDSPPQKVNGIVILNAPGAFSGTLTPEDVLPILTNTSGVPASNIQIVSVNTNGGVVNITFIVTDGDYNKIADSVTKTTVTVGGQSANADVLRDCGTYQAVSCNVPRCGTNCGNGTCIELATTYRCACNLGYELVGTQACQDLCVSLACPQNCVSDSIAGRKCECRSNFYGASCTPCLTCNSTTQYETVPCSQLTNRACAACSSCSSGSYISTPCGATTNTVCTPCTQCSSGQYASVACGARTDATCSDCATCVDGVTYQATACSSTANTVCDSCSVCGSNQWKRAECTALADTDCQDCGQCVVGQTYVTANCTATSNTTCHDCRVCGSGTYQSVPCTLYQNSVCTACSTCPSGQYRSANCTATEDTTCSACTTCASGKYESQACTSTSNTRCTDCPSLPNCATVTCSANGVGVTSVCQQCNTGYFKNAISGECQACTGISNCNTITCTSASNSVCSLCATTYVLNNNMCTACDTFCNLDNIACTKPVCNATACLSETPMDSLCSVPNPGSFAQCRQAWCNATVGCMLTYDDSICGQSKVCNEITPTIGEIGCLDQSASSEVSEVLPARLEVIITEVQLLDSVKWIELYVRSGGPKNLKNFLVGNTASQNLTIRHPTDADGDVWVNAGEHVYGVLNPLYSQWIPEGVNFVIGPSNSTSFWDVSGAQYITLYEKIGRDVRLQDYVRIQTPKTDPDASLASLDFPLRLGHSTQLGSNYYNVAPQDKEDVGIWCFAHPRLGVKGTPGAANSPCNNSDIIINEVFIHSSDGSSDNYFLELVGSGGVSIQNFYVTANYYTDDSGPAWGGEFQLSGRMPMNGFVIIASSNNPWVRDGDLIVGDDVQPTTSSNVLLFGNVRGPVRITVADNNQVTLSELTIADNGDGLPYAADGFAVARKNFQTTSNDQNDFAVLPPTPRFFNNNVTITGWTSLAGFDSCSSSASCRIDLTGTDLHPGLALASNYFSRCVVPSANVANCYTTRSPGFKAMVDLTIDFAPNQTSYTHSYTFHTPVNDLPGQVNWCGLQTDTVNVVEAWGYYTETIYAQLYHPGITNAGRGQDGLPLPAELDQVTAILGWGPHETDPRTNGDWKYLRTYYNDGYKEQFNFEYQNGIQVFNTPSGVYSFMMRFSIDGGLSFTYCDRTNAFGGLGNGFKLTEMGTMTNGYNNVTPP